MSKIIIVVVFLIFLVGCKKETVATSTLANLVFTSVNTPVIANQGKDITSKVKFYAPDLCYHFSGFQIKEVAPLQFEISARATYPNSLAGDIVCLQVVTYFDTTVNIPTTVKGKYILRYYNSNLLFKADTVAVN